MNIPTDLKYTQNDEWIRVEGSTGTIGITDYAQDQLSDVVFVEIIAEPDTPLNAGHPRAHVHSLQPAAHADPYGEAWMVKIETSDASQLEALLDASAYQKHCEERSA